MIAQKIRIFLTTALVLAALGFGYVILYPVSTNGHGQDGVTVGVMFKPARIRVGDGHGVQVNILINGVSAPGFPDEIRNSPFSRVFAVPKGQVITVTASRDLIGSLTCLLVANNDQVARQEIQIGGMVTCSHKVPLQQG